MKRILVAKRVARRLAPATRGAQVRRIVGLLLLCALLVAGCGAADRMFYWPNTNTYGNPAREGFRYEDVSFASADGTQLHGWFVPAQAGEGADDDGDAEAARGTVVYFHGNAQNLSAHWHFVSWLPRRGYNLFLFDYRGFGKSAGEVTRAGTVADSKAALRHVRRRSDVDPDRLVAFGQSLGGACCLAALGESDPQAVRGIAVESTFLSYEGVAADKVAVHWLLRPLGWLLAEWLVSDGHDPADTLERIGPTPLLVIHGTADRIVPFSQGRKLFDAAGEPKQFIRVPEGRHIEAIGSTRFGDTYRDGLIEFFDACLAEGAPEA